MDKHNIEDAETLYRAALKSIPDAFIDGKPTGALFIDPKGASVDRDGDREESVIIKKLAQRFHKNDNYIGAVKIKAGECREIGAYPNPINNESNKYHAEIHDSEAQVEIGFLKAVLLAEKCIRVN